MAREVLIAGCGYVGRVLAERLVARGDGVWGLKRRPSCMPYGVQALPADLSDPETLQFLPAKFDTIVYAVSPAAHEESNYRAAYLTGLRNLLDALRWQRQAPQRLIFVSSTGVFSQSQGEWVSEDSPAEAQEFSGQILLDAERRVHACSIPSVVLRLSGIYGPGRIGMIRQVLEGRTLSPEDAVQWTNRIHRDDAAAAIEHLIDLENPDPLYLGTDCEPATLGVIHEWIKSRIRQEALLPFAGDDPPRQRRGGNKRCDNRRLLASGFQFAFPTFREGYTALLREHGLDREPAIPVIPKKD